MHVLHLPVQWTQDTMDKIQQHRTLTLHKMAAAPTRRQRLCAQEQHKECQGLNLVTGPKTHQYLSTAISNAVAS